MREGVTALAGLCLAALLATRSGEAAASAVAAPVEAESLRAQVIEALGGNVRLEAVSEVETGASAINLSQMYNLVPGGPPAHLSDEQVEERWRPHNQAFSLHTRLDAWMPFAVSWDYQESRDANGTSRSGPADYRPDSEGVLGPAYEAALLKRMWLAHPQWLLLAGKAEDAPDATTLALRAVGEAWRVHIDRVTGLPASVSVDEADGLLGKVEVRVDYADWRDVNGVMVPFRLARHVDGRLNRREVRNCVDVRFARGPRPLPRTDDLRRPELAAWGWHNAHWFWDRAAMARASPPTPEEPFLLEEVGRDIFQVRGSSHHSLIIVGPRGLVLIDAPFPPQRSRAILELVKRRWPDRPLRDVVLTHHHVDHAGGYGPYLDAGARLVAGTEAASFLAAAAKRATGETPPLIAVSDRETLGGLGREIELVNIPNAHAAGMLAAYVPDARLLFVTDLFSPGRQSQNSRYVAALRETIRYHGLDVAWVVGGHGSGRVPASQLFEAQEGEGP